MADIILQKPQAGQVLAIEPQADQNINLEFAADEALLSRDGDNLIFSFEDGSSVELTNFYTAYSSENMPEFVIEGAIIPGEAFFAAFGEELMPAAGNASSPQGSGSNVGTEQGELLNGLDALGRADSAGETVFFASTDTTPTGPTNPANTTVAPEASNTPEAPVTPVPPIEDNTPRDIVGSVSVYEKYLEDGTTPDASAVVKTWSPPRGESIDPSFEGGLYTGENGEVYDVQLVNGKLQFTLIEAAANPESGESAGQPDHWLSSSQVNITLVDNETGESRDVSVTYNVIDGGPTFSDIVKEDADGNHYVTIGANSEGVTDLSSAFDHGADGSGVYRLFGGYSNNTPDDNGIITYSYTWGKAYLNSTTGELTHEINADYTGPDPIVTVYSTDGDGDLTGKVDVTLAGDMNDSLAADAGSVLTGNLLSNDEFLPDDATLTSISGPADWNGVLNDDGSITFTYMDKETKITVFEDGTFKLNTSINHTNTEVFNFNYVVSAGGEEYNATFTVGNAGHDDLFVDHLEGKDAVVLNNTTGTEYTQAFGDYSSDADAGNHHVNGLILGASNDKITVNTAIGSQGNLTYADAKGEDTFIYGDFVNAYKQEDVGNDVINIGILDGTKIRADGHLHNDVVGGNDTINIETMGHGSIIGDGWNLHDNAKGGDDEINVGTMHSGEIYSDARALYDKSVGGDDQVNIGTIDTNLKGNQTITINTASGDDTVTVENIEQIDTGDKVNIDGGLGRDIFNYDNDDANTITMSSNKIDVDGSGASILNFEGISTGGGDDLIKLAGTFDDVFVDGGDDMDVLLANFSTKNEIEDMISGGNITNTEMIVLNNSLNTDSVNSSQTLFDKLEGEGVTKDENGNISLNADSNWTKGDSVGDFDQYTNADNDMTIFIAKSQIGDPS